MNAVKQRRPLVSIRNLKQYFPVRGKRGLFVKANDGIDLDIFEGETFGLVGESGCGKSTLGRVLLQLYEQTDGRTMYYGRTLDEVAPIYVRDTIRGFRKLKSEWRERQAKLEVSKTELEARQKAHDEAPDNDERRRKYFEKLEAYGQESKKMNQVYLDLVQIFGGLIAAEDEQAVINVYNETYLAARRCADTTNKIKKAELRHRPKAVIDGLNAKLDAEKQTLADLHGKIDALRERNKATPGFAEHDALGDDGVDLKRLSYSEMRRLRRDLQLIFQDPYSSLDPRMTVGQIIGEGLKTHGFFAKNDRVQQDYVMKVMEDCGLQPYMIHRYPHQFSGGQRQRIGIARSLAVKPKFVVCDEAVSALDVSIQSQIINLLQELKERDNLTYLFISHDLSVIKYISDRVGVMYLGNMVEMARAEDIFANPMHPYTEALLSAIPTTDAETQKEAIILEGDIPSPINPPKGCKFHTRCRYAEEICRQVTPEYLELAPEHFVACHVRTRGTV